MVKNLNYKVKTDLKLKDDTNAKILKENKLNYENKTKDLKQKLKD